MTSGLVPRLALLLAATDAALQFGAHCRAPRAPQRIAPLRAAVADSRYRKSTDLYKQLEDGRSDGASPSAPATKPVLLAPAGGWPQVEAAIKAGADAVYFGCAAGLNARARATNFGVDELPALMERLHAAGLEGRVCNRHRTAAHSHAAGPARTHGKSRRETGTDARPGKTA